MKFIILASVLMSAFSSVSFAAETSEQIASELCGTVGSHMVGPKCDPGKPCPMWIRLQYDLTTNEGTRYDIYTTNDEISFDQLRGSSICVSGTESKDAFNVVAVSTN